MPKSKKRKTTTSSNQTCPCCGKSYARLTKHYDHNQFCRDFVLGKDTSLVSETNNIEQKKISHNNQQSLEQKSTTINNFDYKHTNDPDEIFFDEIEDYVSLQHSLDDQSDVELSSTNENSNDSFGIIVNNQNNFNDNKQNTKNYQQSNDQIAINLQISNLTAEIYSETSQQISLCNKNPKIECYIDFRKYQSDVFRQIIHLPIDNSMISSIKLLNIIQDGHIPRCYYTKIIQWHNETLQLTNNFDCSTLTTLITSKKRILSFLHDILYTHISPTLSLKPLHDVITLPSKMSTKISKFNLIGSLFSLLTDPDLMQEKNINIYDKSYTNPNNTYTDKYKDIHHCNSFKTAHAKFCQQPNDILVPIIPFIDGTPIDPYGRNNLEVVMYTLGIFNQSTRNKPSAWRIAGYS